MNGPRAGIGGSAVAPRGATVAPWLRAILSLLFVVSMAFGCAGPRALDAAGLNVGRRSRTASDRLITPRAAALGHLELAWLCLLHGVGCDALGPHAEAAVRGAGDMALAQLTRALARQATADIGHRATAWLDLVLWQRAAAARPAVAADLTTLAFDALARLARRDRAGVQGALRAHPLDATALFTEVAGAVTVAARVRRARSLAAWLPRGAAQPGGVRLTGARAPVVAELDAHRVGARLYADLDRAPPVGEVVPSARIALRPQADGLLAPLRLPLPGKPGVYRLHLRWPSGGPRRATLVMRASRPVRVWLSAGSSPGADSSLATTGHRVSANRTWLLPVAADGGVTCTVALPLAAEGERLSVALLPAAASDVATLGGGRSTLGDGGSSLTERLAHVVVHTVLGSEADAAQVLARRYPRGPLAALLGLARPERGPAFGRALDRTLDQLPWHVDARLDRARLARDGGQIGLARRLLEPLARRAARDTALGRRSDLQLEIAGLRQLDGLGDLAVAAAERAAQRQPGDCRTYWQAVEVASDALDRAALRRLLASPSSAPCRAVAPLKLAALQATVGRTAAALRLLKRISTRPGWSRRARAHARALAPDGRARWAWRDASPAARAARAAAEALVHGRTTLARAAWTRILLGAGATPTERRGAWLLGGRAPWRGLTVDGIAWVKAHPPVGEPSAPVTWLLDHEIVVPLPGGGALRRVHQIVRVHTAAAAASVGELSVPPNAELVLARTHTADGRVVSPADTPDKETLSLREVTPGAVVEYVQVQFLGASDPATGATLLPIFLLQSRDGPVVESRFMVLDRLPAGASSPVIVRVDVSPTAPQPQISRHGPWRVRQWRRSHAPRFRLEPRANRPAWHLAAVRPSVAATLESVAGPWADVLAAQAVRRSPALDTWLAKAKRAGTDRVRWRALITDVAAHVADKRNGLVPGSPSAAVRNGRGDRASLLLRLARSAGVQACLVRVQPWSRQPVYGAPDPADYGLSALQLWLRDGRGALRPVWLDPGVDGALLDYLRAGLRRRPALRIGCGPARRLTTPDLGAAADRRDVAISLVWQADGSIDAEVQDTLRGALAMVVRNLLRHGNKDQRIAVLLQLSSASFPGMRPAWLGVAGLDASSSDARTADASAGRPLVLRYRVHGAASPHRRTRLSIGLIPYRLGRRYATLAHRKMTLRFAHQLDLHVTLQVQSSGGVLGVPQPSHATHRLATLTQGVERHAGGLRMSHVVHTTMGLVEPSGYGAFARTLRVMDRAERLILRRSPLQSPLAH